MTHQNTALSTVTPDLLREYGKGEIAWLVPAQGVTLADLFTRFCPDDIVVWFATRPGLLPDTLLRRFANSCGREACAATGWCEPRSLHALEVAESYANGRATVEDLQSARAAAYAAKRSASEAAHAASDAKHGTALAKAAAASAAWGSTLDGTDAATVAPVEALESFGKDSVARESEFARQAAWIRAELASNNRPVELSTWT